MTILIGMEKLIALVFVLGACAADDDGARPCEEFSAEVTQRFETCEMAASECPVFAGALCGTGGDPADCPEGWSTVDCDEGPAGTEVNCTYKGACRVLDPLTIEFDFRQQLDGVDGIAIDTGDSCEFRPCDN